MFAKRMGDSGLIHHGRVLSSEIDNDDLRDEYQVDDVVRCSTESFRPPNGRHLDSTSLVPNSNSISFLQSPLPTHTRFHRGLNRSLKYELHWPCCVHHCHPVSVEWISRNTMLASDLSENWSVSDLKVALKKLASFFAIQLAILGRCTSEKPFSPNSWNGSTPNSFAAACFVTMVTIRCESFRAGINS